MSDENTVGQAVQREIYSKATGETFPVTSTAFGQEEVVFTTEALGDITFSNVGGAGDLLNDEYEVREVAPVATEEIVDTSSSEEATQ